ncbi:MAG: geranylgeranylglycerol-phosphate geranylgeranyltransferase [Candidatus Aenigmarchaeota archaeon]|nr:geranylgeranylglycerol-phosphate geranylgeranyltransferase [Candidatus Aenigmarchaeota archaeon]
MFPYLEILRPINGLMTAIAVWVGSVVAGSALVPSSPVILAILSAFLISGAGMVVNDYYDIQIDRINRPKRPIPSGRMSLKAAKIYAAALFASGIALSYFINIYAFATAFIVSSVLYAYAARLKKMVLVGNVAISALVGTSFIYGGIAAGNYFPTLLLALLAFLANLAREIYKSIEDVLGDEKHGANTLPIKYGVLKAKMVANIIIIVTVLFSFVPYFLGAFGQVYLFFVVIADIAFVSAAVAPVRHSAKICKIAMNIALLAFLAASLNI